MLDLGRADRYVAGLAHAGLVSGVEGGMYVIKELEFAIVGCVRSAGFAMDQNQAKAVCTTLVFTRRFSDGYLLQVGDPLSIYL